MEIYMIKVGLVGIGGMGFVHYNAYKALDGAKITCVADVRVDMAKEKVLGDDVRVYSSIDELLATESVDMIDICTPSYMHTEMAIKALSAGCHVLCEKPMSISSADTARVIEASRRAGKRFMTAHVVRFMAPYAYLKSVVDSGELGAPVHIDMKRLSAVPTWSWEDWMRDVSKSGGAPIDLSIHDIDFARYVFGEPARVGGTHHPLRDNNDVIVSNLAYDGFTVTVTGGWFAADIPFMAEYLAVFERGYVSLRNGVLVKNGETVQLEVKAERVSENTGINIPRADGYADEIEYFVGCLNGGTEPNIITPEDSEATVKLVERILESAIKI